MPGATSNSAPPRAISVRAAGRDWVIARPAALEKLWEAMTPEDFADERIPYWAELWPSSLGLAEWLAASRAKISGRLCADLGCGLGLTAMIGESLGARVLGIDYEQAPLLAARQSAAMSRAPEPAWIAMDWRAPAVAQGALAYLWAADIIYERRSFAPVLELLAWALELNGAAWIAEPGRGIFAGFIAAARAEGWSAAAVHVCAANAAHCGLANAKVAVWELRRQ